MRSRWHFFFLRLIEAAGGMMHHFEFDRLEQRLCLATFFVATEGSDAASGSADNPWKTLQHAADQVSAGDTVRVRPGNYVGFDLRTDGTSSDRIAFRAMPGVTIDSPNPKTPDGINLEGADYVLIEGFEIVGMPRAGIRSVLNERVIIRGNETDSNGRWGIFTGFSTHLLIANNVTTRSATEHGIYVSNSGDFPIIRNNTIWGNRANGIHMNGDASQGGDGIISGAVVEKNFIYDNGLGGGSGINADGVQESLFQNNLIVDNQNSGISLYQIDGAAGSGNNLIVNNTVIVGSGGRWALNIQNASTHNTIINNILYSHHSFRGSIAISPDSLTGFRSDFNLMESRFTFDGGDSVVGFSDWKDTTGQDTSSEVGSPDDWLIDPGNSDFTPKGSGPAHDQATSNSAPGEDVDGTARPQGNGFDIGAVERVDEDDFATVTEQQDNWKQSRLALVIRGTPQADRIRIHERINASIVVTINGDQHGPFQNRYIRVLAHGLEGDDLIRATGRFNTLSVLEGDGGDDTLRGGRGRDIILGGSGQDRLSGRGGGDILIGGRGADFLSGGGGGDILIGGETTHDPNDVALTQILQSWTSDKTYVKRIKHLGRADPGLTPSTVRKDASRDVLNGNSGFDWFWGHRRDRLVGKLPGEVVS